MWTGIMYYYNDIETQTRIELGAVVEGSLPSHNKSSSSDAWRVEYSQISELLLAGPTLGVQDCGCDDEGDPTNYQDPGQGKPDLKEKCWCFILEILDVYLDLELDLLICQGLPSGLYLVMLHTCRTLGTGMNCPSLSLGQSLLVM